MKFTQSDIQYYLDQIDKLDFQKVSNNTFETIRYEGLDEESGIFEQDSWVEAELKVTDHDIVGLKEMNQYSVEKFNYFDILLKDLHNNKLVDLIDYDSGTIKIIKTK